MVAPVDAADAPGFYMPQAEPVLLAKTTGAAIAKGDVLEYLPASDNFRTAAASAVSTRFAVATKPALAADTTVEAVASGPVTVTASAAVGKYSMVKVGGVAGQVTEAAPATDLFGSIVGVYVGKVGANERNGVAFGAAAANDVIIIDLNRRTV